MVKAVHIKSELEGLPVLRGRSPETTAEEARASFTTLADFRDGGIFAGSFEGQSPWERHQKGDEIVQVLEGAAELTILTNDGPEVLELKAGMMTVVPQGCWHRFCAPEGVTVMTATPQPTDHSTADDPRLAAAWDHHEGRRA
ncbi:MAG: cupin domain-containing protein [Pseudomonadota bacterium]